MARRNGQTRAAADEVAVGRGARDAPVARATTAVVTAGVRERRGDVGVVELVDREAAARAPGARRAAALLRSGVTALRAGLPAAGYACKRLVGASRAVVVITVADLGRARMNLRVRVVAVGGGLTRRRTAGHASDVGARRRTLIDRAIAIPI